jgi:hypothetical protein
MVTGNKSRFYFEYPHAAVWATLRDEVPERIKQKTDNEKSLVSIVWFINGIHSPLDVPRGIANINPFFYDSIVFGFVESICAHSQRKTVRDIMMHLDNARRHNSRIFTKCLEQFRPVELHIQFIPQTQHQVASSSLDI